MIRWVRLPQPRTGRPRRLTRAERATRSLRRQYANMPKIAAPPSLRDFARQCARNLEHPLQVAAIGWLRRKGLRP